MTTERRLASPLGMPADTGFLLIPAAVAVFAVAYTLAAVLGITFPPADPFCSPFTGSGDCPGEGARIFMTTVNYANLLLLPGVYAYLWQTRLRRKRMRPFDSVMFPDAAAVIERVLTDTGLRGEVTVLMGPSLGRRAVTGGKARDPYVAFGPELLTAAAKGAGGRDVLEAVLRHELAHVRNRDLVRYQVATSLRTAFLVTSAAALLLLVAELAWSGRSLGSVVAVAIRLAVVILAIELFLRAFFRARELQADLRAAAGNADLIRAALHTRPTAAKLLDRWLMRHPDPAARRSNIDDLAPTLAFSWGHALVGGLFLGLGLTTVQTFVNALVGVRDPVWQRFLPIAILIGLPAALFLSLGVWRDTWRACRLNRRPQPWPAAVMFTIGLVAGSHLAGLRTFIGLDPGFGLPVRPVALLAVLAYTLAYCYWLSALARRFHDRDGSAPRPPRLFLRRFLPVALPVGAGYLLLSWHTGFWADHQSMLCGLRRCSSADTWAVSWRSALGASTELWVAALVLLATLALAALLPRARRPRWVIWLVLGAGALEFVIIKVPALRDALYVDASAVLPAWRLHPVATVIPVTLTVAVIVAAMLRGPAAGPVAALAGFAASMIGWAVAMVDMLVRWNGPSVVTEEVAMITARELLGQVQLVALLLIIITLGVKRLVAAGSRQPETPDG